MINQWLEAQRRKGRTVYLMLDSEGQRQARDALTATLGYDEYMGIYAHTPAAALTLAGPYLLPLDPQHPTTQKLVTTPEQHWGWLASSEYPMQALVEHWRQRLIVGESSSQALYRFHDNRVLGRALAALPEGEYPSYLGPVASVCYWADDRWATTDNPSPGLYPLPLSPAWLHQPQPPAVSAAVLYDNAYRYLLATHVEAFARVATQQDPKRWLQEQLALANRWGWHAPEQIAALLHARVSAEPFELPQGWAPKEDESPDAHFDRMQGLWSHLQQGTPP